MRTGPQLLAFAAARCFSGTHFSKTLKKRLTAPSVAQVASAVLLPAVTVLAVGAQGPVASTLVAIPYVMPGSACQVR